MVFCRPECRACAHHWRSGDDDAGGDDACELGSFGSRAACRSHDRGHFVLVNLGAVVRVVAPASDAPTALTNLLLGMAAFGWSGAYLLALIYGPILVRPSLEE